MVAHPYLAAAASLLGGRSPRLTRPPAPPGTPRRAAAPAPPVPYTRVGQVRLDANGAGTTQVFPAGIDWVIEARSVTIAGATASGATAKEYLDAESNAAYLQGTYDAANDSSSRRQLVTAGQVLYIVFEGGPPNAVATFRATGLAYPPGQGAAHLSG